MKAIFLVLIFFLVFLLAFNVLIRTKSSSKIEVANSSPVPTVKPITLKVTHNDLAKVTELAMEGANGTYGIFIENLKTRESYSFNENREFEAGSLYKLWVMGETFDQISRKEINKSDILDDNSLTIDEALSQMIAISDNYSTLVLSDKLQLSNISSFIKDNGLIDTDLGSVTGSPETTVLDTAMFFEKLYNGKLIDSESSNEMISILKAQTLNEVIPKYLPENIVVAHKTGQLDRMYHDAGIVYTPKGDYIIILFSESDDPTQAAARMAQISKSIFDYFMGGGES